MDRPEPDPKPRQGPSLIPAYVFAGIALLIFSYGLYQTTRRTVVLLSWPEARAVVVASSIEKQGNQHRARIRVRFRTSSETIETDVEHDYSGKAYGWIAEAVERHAKSSQTVVRYNRRHPEAAILDPRFGFRTFGLPLLSIFAGIVFGGVGLLAYRSVRLREAELTADSEQARQHAACQEYLGVGGFVLVIGLACVIAALAMLPSRLEARRWLVVDATFDHGEVMSTSARGSKGSRTVHRPRIYVKYLYDRREYTSTIDLRKSSGNREMIEQLIAAIPKGERYRVRVNPEHPHRIERADAWPLLVPGVFLFAGLVVGGVAILVIRSAPGSGAGRDQR